MPEHVLMRELDGESVILDLNDENYYGLDETGTRMWQALIDSENIGRAYDVLLLEYEVEPEQLETDLEEFVSKLVSKNLLVYDTHDHE